MGIVVLGCYITIGLILLALWLAGLIGPAQAEGPEQRWHARRRPTPQLERLRGDHRLGETGRARSADRQESSSTLIRPRGG